MPNKICEKHGIEKRFYKHLKRKGGCWVCIKCNLERNKAYRLKNREQIKAYDKSHRLKNREPHREQLQAWRLKNRNRITEYRRRTRLTINGKDIGGLSKRPYTKFCEICGSRKGKRGQKIHLAYHHWDDNNLSKGLWVCGPCHSMAHLIEQGIKMVNYPLVYPRLHLTFKKKVEDECLNI